MFTWTISMSVLLGFIWFVGFHLTWTCREQTKYFSTVTNQDSKVSNCRSRYYQDSQARFKKELNFYLFFFIIINIKSNSCCIVIYYLHLSHHVQKLILEQFYLLIQKWSERFKRVLKSYILKNLHYRCYIKCIKKRNYLIYYIFNHKISCQ